MGRKKTNEEFLNDLSRVNPTVTPLEPYVKSSDSILCKCNSCGLEWEVRPANLLHGYGCPACGIKKRTHTQTKTKECFIEELKNVASSIELLSEYNGARRYVIVKCKKCGHEWNALPTNLLKGRGCPECAKTIWADKKRRTESEFQQIMSYMHPNIIAIDEYHGNKDRMRFSCNKCGYKWETTPSNLIVGHGCPRCAKNGKYTQEEFLKRVSEVNPHIDIIGKYQRAAMPVLCRCKLCGNEWESRPNNILSGKGCPKCFHSTTSFIEEAIFESLNIALQGISVLSRDRTIIGRELDIVIPKLKVAIEPGSWKWHKAIINNDLQKRQLCHEKGFRLIIIYTDYPNEEAPFSEDCYVLHETMGFEKDLPALKNLVSILLGICNATYDFSDNEWRAITQIAYVNSRRRTTDEFIKLVAEKHPTINVEGEYTGAWNRIRVRCTNCGNVWSPTANSLLQGHGCNECAAKKRGKNKRKTSQDFLDELNAVNPNVITTSAYETTNTYISCKCKLCGNEWKALPSNLLKGKGCSKCGRINTGLSKRMKPDQFSKRIYDINDKIELLSVYEKSSTKVECRCKVCNNHWFANPSSLLAGGGCPRCAYVSKGLRLRKKVLLVETGQIFESIKDAAAYARASAGCISACLHGK